MKYAKKLTGLLLAMILVLSMAMNVAAAETGTVTVNGVQAGETYDLYKIFDLTYAGTGGAVSAAYTIDDDWAAFFAGDGAEYIVAENNAEGTLNQIAVDGTTKYINITEDNVAEFAQKALAYIANKTPDAAHTATTDEETAGKYVFEGLDLGYYLVYPQGATEVKEGNASICSLTSTTPNAEVNVKSELPDIDKNIAKVNDTDLAEGSKVTSANVGDTVTFAVTGNVPDMTGFSAYTYKLVDTMSEGMTFKNDVAITIGDTTLTADQFTVTTVENTDKTTTVTIEIKDFINYKAQKGDAITVSYSIVMDQDSIKDIAAEFNKVKLVYSKDPKDPENPDTMGETPERSTEVYTTDLVLTKVDGADGSALTGAKFKIEGTGVKTILVNEEAYQESADGTYYRLKNGTYTTTAPTTDTADSYDSTDMKYTKVNVISAENQDAAYTNEGWVDADGKMSFDGLGAGTYTITELVSPAGYNLLKSPIQVVVSFDSTTKTFTATVDGAAAAIKDGVVTFNVENHAGTVLPGTGGMGTTLFYIIGGLLVVVSAVMMITRRRMNQNA